MIDQNINQQNTNNQPLPELEPTSQDFINNAEKDKGQIIPKDKPETGYEDRANPKKRDKKYDFFTALSAGYSLNDVALAAESFNAEYVLRPFEEYAKDFPPSSLNELKNVYSEIEEQYKLYEAGDFNREEGIIANWGKLDYMSSFKNTPFESMMLPPPEYDDITFFTAPEFIYAPDSFGTPLQLNTADQVANALGWFYDKESNLRPYTKYDRMARNIRLEHNPDPSTNSLLPYVLQERPMWDLSDREMIQTFLSPRKQRTSFAKSLLNLSAVGGTTAGMFIQSFAGLYRALNMSFGSLHPNYSTNPEENMGMRIANSMTNVGSKFMHMNQDEAQGLFDSRASFSYHVYSGMGQLFSMAIAGKLARSTGMRPQPASYAALGFGSVGGGSLFMDSILLNGGTEADAARFFYYFSAGSFAANSLFSANVIQKLGFKKGTDILRKNIEPTAKFARDKLGSSIGKLSPQTKDMFAKTLAVKSISALQRARIKASETLTKYSEVTLGPVPAGAMLTSGVEQFIEETADQLTNIPTEIHYNRNFAIPRAEEIIEQFGEYRYETEEDEFGSTVFVKYDKYGNRSIMPWNVWRDEQEDLSKARGVLKGEYIFQEEFIRDAPLSAFFSSFAAAAPLYYIGGAHRARQNNDMKYFRQKIALEIAKEGTRGRTRSLRDVENQLKDEQARSGVFGSDYLTRDGKVITQEQAKNQEGVISVAEFYINQFMQDLKLDIQNIDSHGLVNPENVISRRQNAYLALEALDHIESINNYEKAIAEFNEKGEMPEINWAQNRILKTDKIEDVQKKLEAEREKFRRVTQPKDGVKGNPSTRYIEIAFGSKYKDYIISQAAITSVKEKYKKAEKEIDTTSEEFLTEVRKETNRMMKNPSLVNLLGWVQNSENPNSIINQHGRTNVYSMLEHIYKNVIGQEMTTILNQRNKVIKGVQERAGDSQKIFQKLQSDIASFSERGVLSLAPTESGELTEAQRSQVQQEQRTQARKLINEIEGISQQIESMQDMRAYTEMTGQTANELTALFNQLSEKVKSELGLAEQITDYENFELTGVPLSEGVFPATGALTADVAQITDLLTNLQTTLQGRDYNQTRVAEEISDLSPEQQSQLRAEAINNWLDNQNNAGNTQKPIGRMRFTDMLKGWKTLADNPAAVINNPRDIINKLDNIEENANLLREIVDINVNFIQTLKGEDKVYSMINENNEPHLFITKEEAAKINKDIDAILKDVEYLRNHEKLKVFSRELDQFRAKVVNLASRNTELYHIAQYFTDKQRPDTPDEFFKKFEQIGKLLGEDKHGKFAKLFDKFQEQAKDLDENKADVRRQLNEIRKAIVEAEETLSGKLDNYIKQVSKEGLKYYALREFQEHIPFNRSGGVIDGVMSPNEHFPKYKPNEEKENIWRWHTLTYANLINRYGRDRGNGEASFTQKEVLQAYRDVVTERSTEDFHISTYEQEQLAMHIVNFIVDSDTSLLHAGISKDAEMKLIKNSINIRGYAGTGKTTQVLLDAIQTVEALTGKNISITLLVPTENLSRTHKENLDLLGKSNADYEIIYYHELLEGTKKPKNDIVIADEMSVLHVSDLESIKSLFDNTINLFISDDGQISTTEGLAIDHAVLEMSTERTMPITEVFRTGNPEFFAIQDYFRAIVNEQYSKDMPVLTYKVNENGFHEGGRYYKDATELRRAFAEELSMLPENQRIPENIIFLVPNSNDRIAAMNLLNQEHGISPDVSQDLIYTVEYHPTSELFNTSVSGLSSQRVFFDFDPIPYIRTSHGQALSAKEIGDMATVFQKLVGRIGLTGVSRAITHLAMIGDPALSSVGDIIIDTGAMSKDSAEMLKKQKIEELNAVAGNKSDYRSGEKRSDPKQGTMKDINRHKILTETEAKALAEGENYATIKKAVTVDTKAKINQKIKDGEATTRASDFVVQIESVAKTLKEDNPARKARSNYFNDLIRFALTGEQSYYNSAIDNIAKINKHSDEKINNADAFIQSTLENIQMPMLNYMDDTLFIPAPTLLAENVQIKNDDGTITNVDIEGNPVGLRLVGFAMEDGNHVPIFDLEEFVYHYTSDINVEPGAYTQAKIGMYIALAESMGFKINNVNINNYQVEANRILYLTTHNMSDAAKMKGLVDVLRSSFLNDAHFRNPTADNMLATEQHLLQNERKISHKDYKIGDVYANRSGSQKEIVRIYDTSGKNVGGKYRTMIYFQKDNGNIASYTLDTFKKKYQPIRDSEKYYEGNMFMMRGDYYKTGHNSVTIPGVIHSHSMVPPTFLTGKKISDVLSSQAYKARHTVLNHIYSAKDPISITKQYFKEFDGFKEVNEKLISEPFKHAVINLISDTYLGKNTKMVRDVLEQAGLVQKGEKIKRKDLLDKFKENNYHIVSIENAPEFQYYQKGKDITLYNNPDFNNYMNAEVGSTAESQALTKLEKTIIDGFTNTSTKANDLYLDSNIEYNIAKVRNLKRLATEGPVDDVIIQKIDIGNVKLHDNPRVMTEGSKFLEMLESRNMQIRKIEGKKLTGGRYVYMAEVVRKDMPGSVIVNFDAKPINIQDLNDIITEYINTDAKEIQKHIERIEEIFKDFEGKLTEDQQNRLTLAARAAKTFIENTEAFQFLRANQSQLAKIKQEIGELSKGKEHTINNKKIKVFGDLFTFHNTFGLQVVGNKAIDMYQNVFALLNTIKEVMSNAQAAEIQDRYVFRHDPYKIDSKSPDKSKPIEIDINKLVTNAKEITTPQIFTHSTKLQESDVIAEKQNKNKKDDIDDDLFPDDIFDEINKVRVGEVIEANSMSVQTAVSEFNRLIGEANGSQFVRFAPYEITNSQGREVFGRMIENLIELSTYNVNNVISVEGKTPRHESMHFIMQWMLNESTHKKVVEDIKAELGESWDGTMNHIYEYAAEVFEIVTEATKPKNFYERVIQFIKRVGSRLGLYSFSFREMLNEANYGYYAFRYKDVYSSPNVQSFVELNKTRNKDPYADSSQLIKTFGEDGTYGYIRDNIVARRLKSYMSFGKGVSESSNTLSEAVYRTVNDFFNRATFDKTAPHDLEAGETSGRTGNKVYNIAGRDVKVKDMLPKDFLIVKRKETSNPNAKKDYMAYHLGKKENVLIMIKDFLPNSDVAKLRNDGKLIYENRKNALSGNANKSAALNIQSDAEGQNANDRITDMLNVALNNIPLYSYRGKKFQQVKIKDKKDNAEETKTDAEKNGKNAFVPLSAIKEVMQTSIERMVQENKISRRNLDPETVFEYLREKMDDSSIDASTRNVMASLVLEFGDVGQKTADGNYKVVNKSLQEVGLLRILNDAENINNSIPGHHKYPTDFNSIQKRIAIHNLLSGIVSHFKSVDVYRSGIVDMHSRLIEQRNNASRTIQHSRLKQVIAANIFNTDGTVNETSGRVITQGENQVINVTPDGITVKTGEGDVVAYSKKEAIQNFNLDTIKPILRALGMTGIDNVSVAKIGEALKRQESDVAFDIDILGNLHGALLAMKVNYEASQAFAERVANLNEMIENKTIKNEDIKSYLEGLTLSDEASDALAYLKKAYYGRPALAKMETELIFKPGEEQDAYSGEYNILIPSPSDFYKLTTHIADIITQKNLTEGPQISKTAEGENRQTRNPASELSHIMKGWDIFTNEITQTIQQNVKDYSNNPIINRIGVDGRPIYNNAILSGFMKYDDGYEFAGVKNHYKGKNFKNMTEKDLHIAMIETLFAKETFGQRPWKRTHILMPPKADKSRADILPFYFPTARGKDVQSIINIKMSDGFRSISDITVNQNLFAEGFNYVVDYYNQRNLNSTKRLKNVLTKKQFDAVLSGKEINISEADAAKIKSELQKKREYYIFEDNGKFTLKAGHAILLDNVPFNREFISKWYSNQDAADRYQMLLDITRDDMTAWSNSIKESGALESMINSKDRSAPVEMFYAKGEKDATIESAELTQLRESMGERMAELRGKWIQDNKNMNYEDYLALSETNNDLFREIWGEMKRDIDYAKQEKALIDQLANEQKRWAKESRKGSGFAPALEAMYMAYFLAGESMAHITRGDMTSFDNPSEYIKRGSGLSSPGTYFNLTNKYGIGQRANVITFSDIPGYNNFLEVAKNSREGRELFSDGYSVLNPVWHKMLKRSAGEEFGVVGDYANKTVAYGYDFVNDQNIYFKMAQIPIDATHFQNSSFHQGMMETMLGKHYQMFDYLYTLLGYDNAIDAMALYAADPAEFMEMVSLDSELSDHYTNLQELQDVLVTKNKNGEIIVPRDEMVSYAVHESVFKQNTTGINQYGYDLTLDDGKSPYNISVPTEGLKTISVPNEFLKLQVVNNGDGNINTHSFATQLFSIMGVLSHNAPYKGMFDNALKYKAEQFNDEFSGLEGKALLNHVRDVAYDNLGKNIKGSKIEALLRDNSLPGDVYGPKLYETLVSHLNDHFKPDVPGSNYVQQPSIMSFFEGAGGALFTANDLKLPNDRSDSPKHRRRLLRPLTYVNKSTGTAYESRQQLIADINANPDGVAVAPAEVAMKFHYGAAFGISDGMSLQDVMRYGEGSLYETGYQRAIGNGAQTSNDVAAAIMLMSKVDTNRQLLANLSPVMQDYFTRRLRDVARKQLIKNKWPDLPQPPASLRLLTERQQWTKQQKEMMVNSRLEFLLEQSVADKNRSSGYSLFMDIVSDYYFDLNNALDIVSVRIPTTNASSVSVGRIVAFTETGNTIFTSSEKSILDGSDYDYDELHVFYPDLQGRKKVYNDTSNRTNKENNNLMFESIRQFYGDVRNNEMVLAPIRLDSFQQYADNNTAEAQGMSQIGNSINSNVQSIKTNFAGLNLTGHFANQMIFTNRLFSTPVEYLAKVVNPDMKTVFDQSSHPEVLDFISKLVNAAVDNANLNGLLGRLNINAANTSLIAGMVLHTLSDTVTSDQQETMKNIETKVLDMIQNPIVIAASDAVIRSQSVKNLGRAVRFYEAIDTVSKSKKAEQIRNEIKKYAYAGEQLTRLGQIYKITQEIPGNRFEANRMIYNIEKALGQKLEDFLTDTSLMKALTYDFSIEKSRMEAADEQINGISNSRYMRRELTPDNILHERSIRRSINIPGIAARDQLILSQLNTLKKFKEINKGLFFDSNETLQAAVLEKIKQPAFLYENAFDDYSLAIKKIMIGTFMQNHGPMISVDRSPVNNDSEIITEQYNLSNAKEQMKFVVEFPDVVRRMKAQYGDNAFVQKIDIEGFARDHLLVANFRNSIYLDASEKANYRNEFKSLMEQDPVLADAIRYYNLLVYGFSFRNGTFSEVLDTRMEKMFAKNYDTVTQTILDRLAADPNGLTAEIAFNGDEMLPIFYDAQKTGKQDIAGLDNITDASLLDEIEYYAISPFGVNRISMLQKVDQALPDYHMNDKGAAIVNRVYPKEIFVHSPGNSLTHNFTVQNLTHQDMVTLEKDGELRKKTANFHGIYKSDPTQRVDPLNQNRKKERINVPFDGTDVVTIMGQVAEVRYINSNEFELILKKDKNNPPQSRITRNGSIASEHALDALITVLSKSFPAINVMMLSGAESRENVFGYYHQGRAYINKDKMQVDTFIHELGHPLLQVLKHVNFGQYSALVQEAIQMIDSNHEVARAVLRHYPELKGNGLADEIIVTMMGWHSEKQVADFLAINDTALPKTHAQRIWSRFKNKLQDLWRTIKELFGIYGININPETTTIKEFAQEVVEKALAGEVVLDMSYGKLRNLTRAGWENVYSKKDGKIENSTELFDHLMNTGQIKDGDQMINVKQERDLSMLERITNFKDTLQSKGFVHITKSGEKINFKDYPESQWNKIIEDNILVEKDDSAFQFKKKILESINSSNFNYTTLQSAFGIDSFNNFNIDKAVAIKFLNQIRYHPKHRYMRYSELPGTNFSKFYNEALQGFDPIISIEHANDDQVIISIYNITNEYLRRRDELAPIDRKNILNRYVTDPRAQRLNIDMGANFADVSNLMLGLVASHIAKSGQKVFINNVGTIGFNSKYSKMVLADGVSLKNNMESMLKVEEFKDSLDPQIVSLMEKFSHIDNAFNFHDVLFNQYGQQESMYLKDAAAEYQKKTLDTAEMKFVYQTRLRELISKNKTQITNAEVNEINILLKALNELNNPGIISEQMNTMRDVGAFAKILNPQFDVGHEFIDTIRRVTLATAQKNVREMQNFKRGFNKFAKFFADRYFEKEGVAMEPYVRDITYKYYNEILATVKDQDGIDRYAGHVLWTTDSKLDPMFAEQAQQRNLSPEVLKQGEYLVDLVTDNLVDMYHHNYLINFGTQKRVNGEMVTYTKEMAKDDLFTQTTYKRGMLPLMHDTVGMLIAKGKGKQAFNKKRKQLESSLVQFEALSELSPGEVDSLDAMPDMFMRQFGFKSTAELGPLGLKNERMHSLLNLSFYDGKYYFNAKDQQSQNLNTDLESLMNFFVMSKLRKINYENEVLPILNGAKVFMNDTQTNQDFKQENALEYLNLFQRQAIEGRRGVTGENILGLNVDTAVAAAMSYASPLVMAANINVGAVSAIHNFMMAFIESVTNDITALWSPEEQNRWFGLKETMEGSARYFSDWHKVTELLHQFQLLNPNEYELVTHRFNQGRKGQYDNRKKHIVSDYYAQWTNWAADAYARGVIMTAQMIKDGSYDAHTYDSETGRTIFNPKKDKRFFNPDGSQTDKQKALYEALKKRLVDEGIGLTEGGEATQGYSDKETRVFKALADKYITGAYGPMEKNLLSQFLVGRMTMMFTTWFMTKISNAIKEGTYIDEIGYYDIREDSDGNLVPEWQRTWSEGYLRTVTRMTFDLVFHADTKQFKNMNYEEKRNWTKYALTVATFWMSKLLYSLAVNEDRDPDAKGIKENRFVRNALYAYSSLFVWRIVYEKLDSPFAVVGIIKRALQADLSLTDPATYKNLRFVFPLIGPFHTVDELATDVKEWIK